MYLNKVNKYFNQNRRSLIIFFICATLFKTSLSLGQENRGSVTGFPLPRFVSAKSSKINVRRGPGKEYQVDWVYGLKGNPFLVTAEFGPWRRIEDFQGEGGWVHYTLISGKRYIIFLFDTNMLHRRPSNKSASIAIIKKGVVGELISANEHWVEARINGYSGWVKKNRVWGVNKKEIL